MNWTHPAEQDTIQQLFALGYFQGKEWDEVRTFLFSQNIVTDAVDKYRDFHGLAGEDDPAEHMLRPRCGLPDFVRGPEEAVCKWPMLDVTAAHRLSGLNPLNAEQEHAAWVEMIAAWNAVCGIRLKLSEDMAKANISATVGSTGAGVLAYSFLPCGASPTDQMKQVYNRSTNWSYKLLLNVMIHEVGHAIGLDHGPRGCIMQPTAAGDILRPQAWDIEQAVKRYGLPGPQTSPPPTGQYDLEVQTTLSPGRYKIVPVAGGLSDFDMG